MTSDPCLLPLADLSRLIRSRDLSPVVLAQACLDRIAALDGALHSFVTLSPDLTLNAATQAEVRNHGRQLVRAAAWHSHRDQGFD